jgi:hypothetical protein
MTPCCGLEVQKPTQALNSANGPGNTFYLIPKWSRTLPSLINFSWNIYRDLRFLHLKSATGCQISTLIFDVFLWRRGSLSISQEKYIKEGKVLARLGFQSKIFPGPFTD